MCYGGPGSPGFLFPLREFALIRRASKDGRPQHLSIPIAGIPPCRLPQVWPRRSFLFPLREFDIIARLLLTNPRFATFYSHCGNSLSNPQLHLPVRHPLSIPIAGIHRQASRRIRLTLRLLSIPIAGIHTPNGGQQKQSPAQLSIPIAGIPGATRRSSHFGRSY